MVLISLLPIALFLIFGHGEIKGEEMQDAVLGGNEAYRTFMEQLVQYNVNEYVDLPQIAVMGDTSSGKSSLLSMISQVELPSNDKLTTRCPIMLHMRKGDIKSATVNIIWKSGSADFQESKVDEHSWDELTGLISKAQEHIIKTRAKQVALDIVNVELTCPHCEDLTLIDLPGIVRSHGKDESASLITDIQSLLAGYLENERCVILAILPANVDFHNSQIMAEARKVDPETKRTIPILTKPDLIDSGAEGSVKDLLLGKKTNKFEMGFHMVKGRGQKSLDEHLTIEKGLDEEEAFFSNTEPWSSLQDRSLFGTKNLRVKLGELQMSLIKSSFPEIVADVKTQREAAIQARSKLGDIPLDHTQKKILFRTVKDTFCNQIGPHVLGSSFPDQMFGLERKPSAEFHDAAGAFRANLAESSLAKISDLVLGKKVIGFLNTRGEVKGLFVRMSGDDGYEDHAGIFTGEVGHMKREDLEELPDSELKWVPSLLVRQDPEWLREFLVANRPYKLPVFINTEVFHGILSQLIDNEWRIPSLELLDHTSTLLNTAVDNFITSIDTFHSLPQLKFFFQVTSSDTIEKLKEMTRAKVHEFITREHTPYTQNEELLETLSSLRSKRLMDELLSMNGLLNKQHVHAVFSRHQATSMDDHIAEEMQHALNAYGKIALKRFIDSIPMICIGMFQEFPKWINEALDNLTDSEIDGLLTAPPEKVRAMKEYDRKIEILNNATTAIKHISLGQIT